MSRIFGNPHSHWIRFEAFDQWAKVVDVQVTTGKAEMVWVDVETTGLDPITDVPLEMGIILTDRLGRVKRNCVATWKILALNPETSKYSGRYYKAMNGASKFVREMHDKSGLWNALEETRTLAQSTGSATLVHPDRVARDAVSWLQQRTHRTNLWSGEKKAPISGSSPQFDRSFIAPHLPELHDWFHYRNGADVSAIRNLARQLNPLLVEPPKAEVHRPIPDLLDSIALYRAQIKQFFKLSPEVEEMWNSKTDESKLELI